MSDLENSIPNIPEEGEDPAYSNIINQFKESHFVGIAYKELADYEYSNSHQYPQAEMHYNNALKKMDKKEGWDVLVAIR